VKQLSYIRGYPIKNGPAVHFDKKAETIIEKRVKEDNLERQDAPY
jgi:hypothetical protein